MDKKLYIRLAHNNIKKNKNSFSPFLISIVTMAAVFYMLTSIWQRTGQDAFFGTKQIEIVLQFGVVITALLSVGIIFYTNSFLMKQRTKEFGLYHILGMEKKHIGYVVFWEIVIVAVAGIILGLIIGILFSRLMFLVLLKMMELKAVLEFHISATAICLTLALFIGVFILDILYNQIHIVRLKPIDMLQSSKQGEREPKVKWPLVVVGIICLSIGYYIAITTKNPISAMSKFFFAVLLVIIGTYCLFVAVSILLLKLLKRNKQYYYHPTHFITISDMMYRMKQNAVGLANICIFSTAVLVVLSTTVSLFLGIDDEIRTMYPRNVQGKFSISEKEIDQASKMEETIDNYFQKKIQKSNIEAKNMRKYYQWDTTGLVMGNQFTIGVEDYTAENLMIIMVMIDDQYNELFDTNYQATSGKGILLYGEKEKIPADSKEMIIGNTTLELQSIKKENNNYLLTGNYIQNILILVSDLPELSKVMNLAVGEKALMKNSIEYNYQFDLKGSEKEKKEFCDKLHHGKKKASLPEGEIDNSISGRKEAMAIYAGLLFIGIFIGTLFLIATVLIIYYKQISEGYDMLYLTNVPLFIGCTIGTTIVFFLFYTVIYRLTSGVYYRIVNK